MKKDIELLFGHLVSIYSKEYAENIIKVR